MREHDGVEHLVVGHFLRAGFDHDDLLLGCGDRQLQRGHRALCSGRVDDVLTVHHTDEGTADRPVPRNIRNGEGDGRADHRGDLGRAVLIHGHDVQNECDVVPQVFREQGTDGAVNHTGGEDRLLGGLALAL